MLPFEGYHVTQPSCYRLRVSFMLCSSRSMLHIRVSSTYVMPPLFTTLTLRLHLFFQFFQLLCYINLLTWVSRASHGSWVTGVSRIPSVGRSLWSVGHSLSHSLSSVSHSHRSVGRSHRSGHPLLSSRITSSYFPRTI